MIVVTGGAGFIGSVLAAHLNARGHDDVLLVDHLGTGDKWKNLVGLRFSEYLDKAEFLPRLEAGAYDGEITAIFHLGACSATTQLDADYLMENNYRYTERIARWWERHQHVRFIYASSAATYGDGAHGYDDDEQQLDKLRPLNMYGYSKHLFDLTARRNGWLKRIVGLKYFNVFGPNEHHKGDMKSVIAKAYPQLTAGEPMKLFASHRSDFGDGEQKRDFIYVKDAVAMTLFFLDNPAAGGIFNIGTGTARTWNDLAKALFSAINVPERIEYVPMPEQLQEKYQYFTEANMSKLRSAGCSHQCRSLEESIAEYVRTYLAGCFTYAWNT